MKHNYDRPPSSKRPKKDMDMDMDMDMDDADDMPKGSPEKHLAMMFSEMTSSLYVLSVKLKGFHWNIVGDQFFPIHKELDCQVDALVDFADGAAENVRQLKDSPAPASMNSMLEASLIDETSEDELVTTDDILTAILADYQTLVEFCDDIISTSDNAKRQDLSDFAISVKQYLNKYIWQFKSSQ